MEEDIRERIKRANIFVDITAPAIVEVQIRSDGKVIWVNVNGECRLRICQIKNLVVEDERVHANVTGQAGNTVLRLIDEEDCGSD